jgi:hypothetical protein
MTGTERSVPGMGAECTTAEAMHAGRRLRIVVESLNQRLPRAASRVLNSAFVVALEKPRDRGAA